MTLRTDIELTAAAVPRGSSIRVVCPVCNGGNSHERSLSITRNDTGALLYICFRGSCSLRPGYIGSTESPPPPSVQPDRPKLRFFEGVLVSLPKGIYEHRYQSYGIAPEVVESNGVRFAPEYNRIYSPIFDARGHTTGEALKAVGEGAKPKILLNHHSLTVPLIHFPLGGYNGSGKLVLVEDMVSALKIVSRLAYNCAAILGTNITDECLRYLKAIGITDVILMLDGDRPGIDAALRLKPRLDMYFSTTLRFPPNGLDPKDMSVEALKEALV